MKGNIPCVPLDPTQTHLPHMCSCLGSTGKAKMQTVSAPGMPLTQGCMLLTVVCRIAEWAREHVWLMCEPWGFLYNISCRDHSNDVIAQRTGISTNMSVKTNRLSVGLLKWMFKTRIQSAPRSFLTSSTLTLHFWFSLTALTEAARPQQTAFPQHNKIWWTALYQQTTNARRSRWRAAEEPDGDWTGWILSVKRKVFTYKVICRLLVAVVHCAFSPREIFTPFIYFTNHFLTL